MKLNEFFSELSKKTNNKIHRNDFTEISDFFPVFCRQMGLSLRDIDYCVRSIVFVAKTIKEGHYMYPHLISVLIVLRLKNPSLYLEFRDEKCFPSKVMNYIDKEIPVIRRESHFPRHLDSVEYQLYYIHESRLAPEERESSPLNQLILLINGEPPTHPEYLSKRTEKSGKKRSNQVLSMEKFHYDYPTIKYIFSLIELVGTPAQE